MFASKTIAGSELVHLGASIYSYNLSDYEHRQIIGFFQFGCPVVRDMNTQLEMGGINHKGTTDHAEQVVPSGDQLPFLLSALDRRIIMDCNWLIGISFNDGIDKDSHLGEPLNLSHTIIN